MRLSVVVAVSAILLFRLFRFVFYCETTARAPCGKNGLLLNNFNAHVRPVRLQKSGGVRTVHARCSDDEIRITCTVRCPSRTLKK